MPYLDKRAKKHFCQTEFPYMLAEFIGMTLGIAVVESKISYHFNDSKIIGKTNTSLGIDLIGKPWSWDYFLVIFIP